MYPPAKRVDFTLSLYRSSKDRASDIEISALGQYLYDRHGLACREGQGRKANADFL
jgi:hypothetical protein